MTPEAYQIRDALAERIAYLGGFKAVRTSLVEPVEPDEDMPSATVFLIREAMSARGDANTGPPFFDNRVTLGVVVSIRDGEKGTLDQSLALHAQRILDVLLRDPDFLVLIEGIEDVSSANRFPPMGETYYGETRIEATVLFATIWEPIVPDDFRRVVLRTRQREADPNAPGLSAVIDINLV